MGGGESAIYDCLVNVVQQCLRRLRCTPRRPRLRCSVPVTSPPAPLTVTRSLLPRVLRVPGLPVPQSWRPISTAMSGTLRLARLPRSFHSAINHPTPPTHSPLHRSSGVVRLLLPTVASFLVSHLHLAPRPRLKPLVYHQFVLPLSITHCLATQTVPAPALPRPVPSPTSSEPRVLTTTARTLVYHSHLPPVVHLSR